MNRRSLQRHLCRSLSAVLLASAMIGTPISSAAHEEQPQALGDAAESTREEAVSELLLGTYEMPSLNAGSRVRVNAAGVYKDCLKVEIESPEKKEGVQVLLAAYTAAGRMIGSLVESVDLKSGSNSFEFPQSMRGYRFKLFVLDKNLCPICGATSLTMSTEGNHQHNLKAVQEKAATCTAEGNIAHWVCADCGKLFKDEEGKQEISDEETVVPKIDHTIVTDPAVAPTKTTKGLTEGTHCSVCGAILLSQKEVEWTDYKITYDISNGESYLERLVKEGKIENANPAGYSSGKAVTLKNLSVPGYRFLGWYDGAGSNASQKKKIEAKDEGDLELYAHWEKITYTVQYKSSLFLDRNEDTYTVDRGLVLPTPALSNYIFVGWTDEDGDLFNSNKIPSGTTGDIVLQANWTSERNKAWTKDSPGKPVIHEDEENGLILFAYDIGEIQNVPLYTIKDFGYIEGGGVTKTEKATYTATISESAMQNYNKTVADATTESSNWTLSNDWNESTRISQEWLKENGYTEEQAQTVARSETGNWNISNGTSGSVGMTATNTREVEGKNEVRRSSENGGSDSEKKYSKAHVNAGLDYSENAGMNLGIGGDGGSIGVNAGYSLGINVESGREDGREDTNTSTWKRGVEATNSIDLKNINTQTATAQSSWNSSASYGGSSTASRSQSISKALSEKICETYGYGKEYVLGGSAASSQGKTVSKSTSDSYSCSVDYSTSASQTVESSWTTSSTKPGYHRWIVAGTAHVFAVVGYDMAKQSYFVYTYTVMDDERHEFEDYSYVSSRYDDNENGVISFEVPIEVNDYVAERTCASAGLKVNQSTGVITGYTGTDNCVVIPEYMNVGGGDVVKVTGISKDAFRGNQDIVAVILSDFVTEIPDGAFAGCTSLAGVSANGIRKIGKEAFRGCSSIVDVGVHVDVTSLGENAFSGAGRLHVNAANAGVAIAAASSGASEIYMHLGQVADRAAFAGREMEVSADTKYFELNGYGGAFSGFSVVSHAEKTVLNKVEFENTPHPLKFYSKETVLNQAKVHGNGIAAAFLRDGARLGVQGDIELKSDSGNTLLCRDLSVYESNASVDGRVNVSGNIYTCGEITGDRWLTYDGLKKVSADVIEKMLTGITLTFDAQGGTCDETAKVVSNGTAVGTLPVPVREDHIFTGWFLSDGTQVIETTVLEGSNDQTLYAHWEKSGILVSFDANGGDVRQGTVWVKAGQSLGEACGGSLPVPVRECYDFTGGSEDPTREVGIASTETTFSPVDAGEKTYYAHWAIHPLSDWVLRSNLPSDARVESTKWTVESLRSSLEGFTLYDTTSDWGAYGGWSSWQDNEVSGSESREVQTQVVAASYNMSSYYWKGNWYSYNPGGGGNHSKTIDAWTVDHARTLGEGEWLNAGGAGTANGYIRGGTAYIIAGYPDEPEWVQAYFKQSQNNKTQWRFRDRSRIYTYYFQKIVDGESDEIPSGSGMTNPQQWVRYRMK